jgi:hypothetical protein
MAILFVRAMPYFVALVFSVGEIPSRLLAHRHRMHIPSTQIEFASRWNKVAETVGYLFLVLFYALSEIGELFRHWPGIVTSVSLMIGGSVYAALVLMALWLFCSNLQEKATLPSLKVGRFVLGFDALILITKSVGILFPATLDLWLASRTITSAASGVAH